MRAWGAGRHYLVQGLAIAGLGCFVALPTLGSAAAETSGSSTAVRVSLPESFSYRDLALLPIQHQGRVKPLESFANSQFRSISGERPLHRLSAISWLAELLFDPAQASLQRVFHIATQELVDTLGLEPRHPPRYAFAEVASALPAISEQLQRVTTVPSAQLSPLEKALSELYQRLLLHFEISRSLSMVLPDFRFESATLAEELGFEVGSDYSYMQILRARHHLESRAAPLRERPEHERADAAEMTADTVTTLGEHGSGEERDILRLSQAIQRTGMDAFSQIFRIVPPQWEGDQQQWYSPWGLLKSGLGSPASARQVKLWSRLARAYRAGDAKAWSEISAELRTALQEQMPSALTERLEGEYYYQKLSPFLLSALLYLLAGAALIGRIRIRHQSLYWLAWIAAVAGVIVHTGGLATRIWLLERPPVGTLYESILFVALIGALFGLVLAFLRDDGVGLSITSLIGSLLLLLAPSFAGDETLGVLVAVLNNNFWLATHVLTISAGYGCCLAAGVGAHYWLLRCALGRGAAPGVDDPLARALLGLSLVACFLTLFGTILGGIWADQSWGRFWGWDPKENGALLITLWLIYLLHARIAGSLNSVAFAVGLIVLNIIVALAWFGVNLLSIGLHSYGFTDGAALGLALFCVTEMLFGLVLYTLACRAVSREA